VYDIQRRSVADRAAPVVVVQSAVPLNMPEPARRRSATMAILEKTLRGSILVAQLNRDVPTNPMNRALEQEIIRVCQDVEDSPNIKALVLTGGRDRSFCVGGDFNEVRRADNRPAIEELIDRCIGLYISILQVTKPTIAAIDGYAIGLGFQMALSCDWRIGTSNTQMIMWELKKGVACPLGAYMLEKFFTRAAMLEFVYGCEPVPIHWALEHKLLNEVTGPDDALEKAVVRAEAFCAYPEISYRRTKESINRSFIAGLQDVAKVAREVHVASFTSKSAEQHFNRVLSH
jgi:carboxymethylproline synthase